MAANFTNKAIKVLNESVMAIHKQIDNLFERMETTERRLNRREADVEQPSANMMATAPISSMQVVEKMVCEKTGHKITKIDLLLKTEKSNALGSETSNSTFEMLICWQCGHTLAEIRGEEKK